MMQEDGVRYPEAIDPASATPGDFTVEGRAIDEVRVGTTPEVPEKSTAGKSPAGEAPGMGLMRADRTLPDLSVAVRQSGTLFSVNGISYKEKKYKIKKRTQHKKAVTHSCNGF